MFNSRPIYPNPGISALLSVWVSDVEPLLGRERVAVVVVTILGVPVQVELVFCPFVCGAVLEVTEAGAVPVGAPPPDPVPVPARGGTVVFWVPDVDPVIVRGSIAVESPFFAFFVCPVVEVDIAVFSPRVVGVKVFFPFRAHPGPYITTLPAHLGPVFRVPDVEDTVVVDKVKTPVSVPRVPNGVCPGVFFKFVVQEAIAVAIKGVAMSCPCPASALIAPLGPESWIVDIEPAIITVESLVVDQVVEVDFVE